MEDDLLSIHLRPDPNCLVDWNIQEALETVFINAQRVNGGELARTSMAQQVRGIKVADMIS